MTCIPLVSLGRVIGKLGLYTSEPQAHRATTSCSSPA